MQREAAAAERAETIRNVMQIEHALTTLHLHDFVPVTRPVLPPPHPPNVAALIEARERQALDGISVFERSKRREATEWAQQAGQRDAQAQWAEAQQTHADQQAVQDELWHKLIAHHEPTVHDALEDAFEDNQSPAACIDVGKDFTTHAGARYATVLIVFGPLDLVPERRPAVTPTGKPTLHKRTKAERNDFYIKALGSTILATVKEGLAVAPSLTEIRVVVVRKDPNAMSAESYVEWIYAARFPRRWVADLPWEAIDPGEILLQAPEAVFERRGAAGTVAGLPVNDEAGIAAIIESVRTAL